MAPSLLSSLLFIFTSAVAGEVNVTSITLGQVSFYDRGLAEASRCIISFCLSVPGDIVQLLIVHVNVIKCRLTHL